MIFALLALFTQNVFASETPPWLPAAVIARCPNQPWIPIELLEASTFIPFYSEKETPASVPDYLSRVDQNAIELANKLGQLSSQYDVAPGSFDLGDFPLLLPPNCEARLVSKVALPDETSPKMRIFLNRDALQGLDPKYLPWIYIRSAAAGLSGKTVYSQIAQANMLTAVLRYAVTGANENLPLAYPTAPIDASTYVYQFQMFYSPHAEYRGLPVVAVGPAYSSILQFSAKGGEYARLLGLTFHLDQSSWMKCNQDDRRQYPSAETLSEDDIFRYCDVNFNGTIRETGRSINFWNYVTIDSLPDVFSLSTSPSFTFSSSSAFSVHLSVPFFGMNRFTAVTRIKSYGKNRLGANGYTLGGLDGLYSQEARFDTPDDHHARVEKPALPSPISVSYDDSSRTMTYRFSNPGTVWIEGKPLQGLKEFLVKDHHMIDQPDRWEFTYSR